MKILLLLQLMLILGAIAARSVEAAVFQVKAPVTWQRILAEGEEKQIYFNTQSKQNERVVLQVEAISAAQSDADGLTSLRKAEFSRNRAEFFASVGLHGYSVFDIETRKRKPARTRSLTVVHSHYHDLRGRDVQMVERFYVASHRLYTVTYLIDAPALNNVARSEFAMDQFQPVPVNGREPASETIAGVTSTERPPPLKSSAANGITELDMSTPANQRRCAEFCKDEPDKCRKPGEPTYEESLKEVSMLNKGWGCLVGLKDGALGIAEGVFETVAFAWNYGKSWLTDGVYKAEVHAAVGAVAAELIKEPVAFSERLAGALFSFLGTQLGDFFYCANTQEQWRQICDLGTNMIPAGIVVKLAMKIPLVAKEVAALSEAVAKLRAKTLGRVGKSARVSEAASAAADAEKAATVKAAEIPDRHRPTQVIPDSGRAIDANEVLTGGYMPRGPEDVLHYIESDRFRDGKFDMLVVRDQNGVDHLLFDNRVPDDASVMAGKISSHRTLRQLWRDSHNGEEPRVVAAGECIINMGAVLYGCKPQSGSYKENNNTGAYLADVAEAYGFRVRDPVRIMNSAGIDHELGHIEAAKILAGEQDLMHNHRELTVAFRQFARRVYREHGGPRSGLEEAWLRRAVAIARSPDPAWPAEKKAA